MDDVIAEGVRKKKEIDVDDTLALSPFARASDFARLKGLKVVNFDLTGRIDQQAIDFLIANSSLEYAIEEAYDQIRLVCSEEAIPRVLEFVFPDIDSSKLRNVEAILAKTYMNHRLYLDRSSANHEYKDFLRETFMRRMLIDEGNNNDTVICHPDHAQQILTSPELITKPEQPAKLFEFTKL